MEKPFDFKGLINDYLLEGLRENIKSYAKVNIFKNYSLYFE